MLFVDEIKCNEKKKKYCYPKSLAPKIVVSWLECDEKEEKLIGFWLFDSCTFGENIIVTIRKRNNFCYPLKMVIFPILR